MSSSGEVAHQRRHPTVHSGAVGQRAAWSGAYRWEAEHASSISTEVIPSPTVEDMPMPEVKPFIFRPGVHVHHDHRPTMFPRRNIKCAGGDSGQVIQGQTAITGKVNKRGWKTTKQTDKVKRKQRRAAKWVAKFG